MEQVLKLRRFLDPRPAGEERAVERCDFCAAPIAEEHSHVVDISKRSLLCVCRACYLLFTNPGAAGGTLRAVPERYLLASGMRLSEAQWDAFGIPVAMAFFFRNSTAGRVLAFYPSPAGATESSLPLEAWDGVVKDNPVLGSLRDDVEALLVRKQDGRFECYIVPIDACYELVGRIRRRWRGFHGGDDARREIDAFFTRVRVRCGA